MVAAFIGILMMATFAQAIDKTVAWDAVPAADGYRLSTSIDMGVTWIPAELSGLPVGDISVETTETILTISDTTITLVRASSFNNIGEVINTTSSVWFNPMWELLAAPVSLRSPGE
jgi:hypothetical protein